MKTPITDAVYPPEIIDREFKKQGRTYGWGSLHDMREAARRLELDRAALMEAVTEHLNPFNCRQKTHEKLMAALTAARANFPEL